MDEPTPTKSIFDLNNDCMIHICSFLTQTERLHVALSSPFFTDVIGHFILLENISVGYIMDNFTPTEANQLFRHLGPFVKRIDCFVQDKQGVISDDRLRKYFHIIPKYCHNIEEIVLGHPFKPDFGTFKRIFERARRITKVNVEYARRLHGRLTKGGELDAHLDELFKDLFINSLDLSYLRDFVGKILPKLKFLEHLNIEYCDLVKARYFNRLLKQVKLKTLNIINVGELDDLTFETMYATQTLLERIDISNNLSAKNLELIGRLEGLRHIHMEDYKMDVQSLDDLIRSLVENHAADLETLEIYSDKHYPSTVTTVFLSIAGIKSLKKLTLPDIDAKSDDFLQEIIKNCTKLEELNIIVHENASWIKDRTLLQIIASEHMRSLGLGMDYHFNTKLLDQIHAILQKKNLSLDMFLDERSVDTSIMNTPEYKENEHLFRIHVNEVKIDDMLSNSFFF